MRTPTNTVGGGRHHTAYIGGAPEHRGWQPGDPTYPPEIHATARIEAYVTVDAGMYRPTRIGAHTWLMKKAHAGHDAIIGERCELAPGVVIGGSAEIGDGVKIGVNASVLPYVKIGNGARVGAGAVVVSDVLPGDVVAGVPARSIKPPSPPPATPNIGLPERRVA
jgi:acyl-[acyl carrier protein]--UDP-N-acetylglucosamine O-acyltransferase